MTIEHTDSKSARVSVMEGMLSAIGETADDHGNPTTGKALYDEALSRLLSAGLISVVDNGDGLIANGVVGKYAVFIMADLMPTDALSELLRARLLTDAIDAMYGEEDGEEDEGDEE